MFTFDIFLHKLDTNVISINIKFTSTSGSFLISLKQEVKVIAIHWGVIWESQNGASFTSIRILLGFWEFLTPKT